MVLSSSHCKHFKVHLSIPCHQSPSPLQCLCARIHCVINVTNLIIHYINTHFIMLHLAKTVIHT